MCSETHTIYFFRNKKSMAGLCRKVSGHAAALLALLLLASCAGGPSGDPGATGPGGSAPASRSASDGDDWFVDRAEATGLDFTHFNGASGNFYYPEILPPGVALLDFDNDGDLDVYLVQGRTIGAENGATATSGPPPPKPGGRLFRNDLRVDPDGTRALRFTDVTESSGIRATGFGLGVAAADVDNDGRVDLFLTNFGANQLYHNNGDGTFADVSRKSGLVDTSSRFAVSAAFVDYDRDGWLDLYVGNNVVYTIENATKCPNMAGARDYCPPQIYGGQPDRLYRNLRNGTFADVTARALVGGTFGPALGVSTADFNGDGWIDIYVANDGEENLLWLNQRNGTLVESALVSGAAVTAEGRAESSMGVDAGDFDNDGDEDLFISELTGQGSNLFVNDGSAKFRDLGAVSGLGQLSQPYTGWGTAWFDFDNDGWLDLLTVNGTIVVVEGRANQPFPYDQRKVLFRNLGDGRFEDVTRRGGSVFDLSEAGRGAAFGDIDNDGDVDVLVGNDNGRARLLVNNIGNRQHWLGLRLVGRSGRDMLGARVAVSSGGSTLWRRARSDGSYGSANDPRVLVGLGKSTDKPRIEVRWPGGRVERWNDVEIDRWTTLKEGTGQ
jgi:hypothetical protein